MGMRVGLNGESVNWKKKEYVILLFLLAEFLIVCVYSREFSIKEKVDYFINGNEIYADNGGEYIDTNVLNPKSDGTVQRLCTTGMTLDRGIYNIYVRYEASGSGTAEVFGNLRNSRGMWSDTVKLVPEKREIAFPIWVNEKTDGIGVSVRSDGEEVRVDYIQISTAWNSGLYFTLILALKMLLADGILFLILFHGKLRKYSVQICGILGITVICSVGLFNSYLTYGHDMVFHMNRIEGLKDGFLSGVFPVRVQPTWNNGWGYAVSVMYGDLTLILPALMRIAGFPLQTAWKTYVVTVNFLTAVFSFYSFYKICRNKYSSLFASLLYCTGTYRLACIYLRAAVGEFTVMMFLPLVVLGFWYAFGEDTAGDGYGERIAAPVAGFTGMIQTHVLTCEMSAIFIVILCFVLIKKVVHKKTFMYLFKILIWTVLINLWFLVPFISFMGEELVISEMVEMREDFQTWGLSFTELFATSPSRAYNFTFGENVSLADKCTFSLGTALWLGAAISLILLWNGKVKKPKAAAVSLAFGAITAFMATNLFPYQRIKEYFPHLAALLAKIQFSYRFLGLAGLFFSLAIFFSLKEIGKGKVRNYLTAGLIAISVLAVYQGMDYQYQILYGGSFENKYSPAVLDTAEVVSGEYLYRGSSVDVEDTLEEITGSGVTIDYSYKKYLDTVISCKSDQNGAYIEIPVFYYPGYTASDREGREYQVSRSENNNRIRVELPNGFDGTIEVYYREPFSWRVCEVISLLALAGLLFYKRIKMAIPAEWGIWRKI